MRRMNEGNDEGNDEDGRDTFGLTCDEGFRLKGV
jgi:hypothetical protein